MSRTAQEGEFILPKVIKGHEEKRPEGRMELPKLKTIAFDAFLNKYCGKLSLGFCLNTRKSFFSEVSF